MRETLIKLALAPLLLLQGVYVRGVTPRLPEPQGERAGTTGTGPHLRLLVLGDSAAAGVGVTGQAEALTGQLVNSLASDYRVSWKLIAQTGLNTAQLHALVERSVTEPFDAVVVSVGLNDVTGGASVAEWTPAMSRLLDLLQWKYSARHILIAPIPPMHAFPSLPQPLRWYLGRRARQFNVALKWLTRRRMDCHLQACDFPMQRDSLAADGFHPGAAAYALWGSESATTLRECFADPQMLSGRVVMPERAG